MKDKNLNSNIDNLFIKPIEKKFEFDETVASVFDDMIERSVPFYKDVLNLITELIVKNPKENLKILDLGTSTANLLLSLNSKSKNRFQLIGVDNSISMIERAKSKCRAFGAKNVELILGDIESFEIKNFDIVVSNYTLQFIRPIKRLETISKIFNGLNQNGEFFFSEKVVFEDRKFDKDIIDIYYKYKKEQGYSDYEIAMKREALENVLIPFTINENIKMCRDAGFKFVDTIFQWANFVTFRAKKC